MPARLAGSGMQNLLLSDEIARATELHQQGRLDETEVACGAILARLPEHPVALHLLGLIAAERRRLGDAAGLLAAALIGYQAFCEDRLRRREVVGTEAVWNRMLEAKQTFDRVTSQQADQLKAGGRTAETAVVYQRWSLVNRALARSLAVIGESLSDLGRIVEAIALLQRAVILEPEDPEPRNALGIAYRRAGRLAEAVAATQEALRLKPDFYQAHNTLGLAYEASGQGERAIACYRQAITLRPGYARAENNLAVALESEGHLDQAEQAARRAIALEPALVEAHNNLGNILRDTARCAEAIRCYRTALQIDPGFALAHSNLLYALHFDPDLDGERLLSEHLAWASGRARPSSAPSSAPDWPRPHQHDRSRRLRVGYVSGDFRQHPVGRFILPLLAHHDPAQVEVLCYANSTASDSVTEAIRARAGVWRNIVGVPAEDVARQIRADEVDILVDLGMHTRGNRLDVFALGPAPVQLSYLAYCSTTGLGAIGYRLTDSFLDPPELGNGPYRETSIRLASYWCYDPLAEFPATDAVPAAQAAGVTFGCLNQLAKVSAPFADLCCRLLGEVAGSRLLLHAPEGQHRERLRGRLSDAGLDPDRLTFVGGCSRDQYMDCYNRIDVALDPFPYGGGTTTCDALWMGVPVVSLVGRTAVGRGGASILSQIDRRDLVTDSADKYLETAARLAGDLPRLAELRRTLRERMKSSRLMDAPAFARDVERAFREMWSSR